MSNSQTKPVAPLSEEAIAKIKARALQVKELVGVGQFGEDMLALCQTVRALRQEQTEGETCELCNDPTNDEKGNPLTFLVCGRCWNANVDKNREIITALRDQLAQVKKERDALQDQIDHDKDFDWHRSRP